MTLSIQNVNYYKYSENAQMNTIFSGPYPTAEQTSTKDENGIIDLKDKAAKQVSKLVRSDYGCTDPSTQNCEAYLIGDKLYTKIDGKWTESTISDPVNAFQERNKLKGVVGLISSSDIEVIGTEVIDGQRCYKLRMVPELHAANSMLADQAIAAYSLAPTSLPTISSNDLSEGSALLDNSNISYTIWITSATYIPKMMNAEIKFALTPASLKGGSDSMPDFRIDASTKDTIVFSDFNVHEKIGVPIPEKH